MHPRRFALIAGVFMLAMGVLAFIPALSRDAGMILPTLKVTNSYGAFLGFFPMNIVNKIALIGFGLAGLYAATRTGTSLPASIRWSRIVFMAMGVLAILGMIPATNTLFGYWPLFGGEIVAHGVFAVLGAYFGYTLSAKVPHVDERVDAGRPTHAHV
ncbi:MAG: DUF4383 domain-containing protein [Bdellovibrionota bacterium]